MTILPSQLTQADIGRHVTYRRDYCKTEFGVLSSWNDKFVFVRFKGPGGEACEPDDVSFTHEPKAAIQKLKELKYDN